jgi:uncharacterized protein (DUF1697 family)
MATYISLLRGINVGGNKIIKMEALKTAHTGIEQIYVRGQEAYLFYPDGMARSKLDNPTLERRLGVATGRNWNTVNKLRQMVGE